jgi:hypothetical protein
MVTRITPEIRESIDWYLSALTREWECALEIVYHLNRGDADWGEPEDLYAEWFLAIDRLAYLVRLRQQRMFSPEQESQFQELQRFMREHEAELETVLGPGGAQLGPYLDQS